MNLITVSDGLEAMEASDRAEASIPFGLFELDSMGTVTYYSPQKSEKMNAQKEKLLR